MCVLRKTPYCVRGVIVSESADRLRKAVGFTEEWYLPSGLVSIRDINLGKFSNLYLFAHLKIR